MGIFVVKKIKGHYYVYMEYREKGEYKIKYVGPLERVMKEYFQLKKMVKESMLVDRPGFEPGTSRMPTERSTRLSYRPTYHRSVYVSLI